MLLKHYECLLLFYFVFIFNLKVSRITDFQEPHLIISSLLLLKIFQQMSVCIHKIKLTYVSEQLPILLFFLEMRHAEISKCPSN